MAGAAGTPMDLKSELQFSHKLWKFRMNNATTPGLLDTNRLSKSVRSQLHMVLQGNVSAFQAATGGNPDALYVVVDSGASHNLTNSFDDVIPGSLKKLDSPIEAGGIAGGLTMEYEGLVEWETLDTYGNPIKLVTPALVCEELPCRLLSPQSFLTHSSQHIEDHFCIYCN